MDPPNEQNEEHHEIPHDDILNAAVSEKDKKKRIRGIVRLKKIIKDKINGIRRPLNLNSRCQAIGPSAKDLQNYLGLQARTMVPINIKDWQSVPKSTRDNLWTDANV